jgi:hypothetical protein
VQYWVPWVTSTNGSFAGGDPAGFTSGAGGITAASQPRWQNWTATYTNVTDDDLVKKVRDTMYNTKFMSPSKAGLKKKEIQRGIYTNRTVVEQLERLVRKQNDNLGSDLAKYDGEVHIGKVPVTTVPFYDSYTTSCPVYVLNWRDLFPCYLRNWYMRMDKAHPVYTNNCQVAQDVDSVRNFKCNNRRTQGIVAKANPAAGV